jgi:uncharacterized RDD family membrane protein YckC
MAVSVDNKAGFGPRFGAWIIDFIIISVISVVLQMVLDPSIAGPVGGLIGLVYVIGFWVSSGATPGKRALGLRVVSTDGSPITIGKAIMRYIGYIVSGLVLCLGYIWVLFDANKQGWHDKIAGTYVVRG